MLYLFFYLPHFFDVDEFLLKHYFFEVLTDDEISPAFVCQLLNSGDEDVYKFARKDFVCPDTQQEYQIVNPYSQKDSNSCGDT